MFHFQCKNLSVDVWPWPLCYHCLSLNILYLILYNCDNSLRVSTEILIINPSQAQSHPRLISILIAIYNRMSLYLYAIKSTTALRPRLIKTPLTTIHLHKILKYQDGDINISLSTYQYNRMAADISGMMASRA